MSSSPTAVAARPIGNALVLPAPASEADNIDQAKRRRSRDREPFRPEPVEATVWWWFTNDGRSACMENQFSEMPAMPIRFRCLGSMSAKSPKRYRVDLVQTLDRLPELNRRELKSLGATLTAVLEKQLGMEVAVVPGDLIDTEPFREE